MHRANWFFLTLLVGGCVSSASALDFDVPKEIPNEPFDIQAARLEYTNETLFASGGVTGRFENVMVRADELSGNTESGDLSMKGHVVFERDNVVWQGSALDYNYISQTGNFGPSTLNVDPVLLSVDHVERVSTNEYLLKGATFTTCPKEHPHIQLRADRARLMDGEYVQAHGVVVYVGKVPVFYLPYWYHRLSERIFSFKFGYSSEWGAFGLIKATVPLSQEIDWVSDINLYGNRGVGFGQGIGWNLPRAKGSISAFYLNDEDPYARFDSPPESDQTGKDRYRFKLEHLQHFSNAHYVNTKWNYLSDSVITEEFFKSEYRRSRQPENYGDWVLGGGLTGSEAFVSKRVNDYYDNVDRAEYRADFYRTRLGKTPFFFQSENALAHLERVYAETNTVDTYDSVRADSCNALTLPQRYGFLRVVPRATYRATYYSKTAAANGGGEEARLIPGAGMEVSLQAATVLSDRSRWYGKGLRHKIEPYADYIYEDSSMATNRLLQFDRVDMLADENKVKVGLRNVLQTKREGRLARFIDLDLYTHYLVERDAPEDVDLLYIDARMPLTQRTMIDVEGEYDWYAGTVPFFSTRISHTHEDVVFSLSHLYRDADQSLWTPRINLFPEGDMSFEAYGRYDDNSNDLQEVSMMVFKNWCCMRYGLGTRFYDDSEFSIMLSIGLSAFPEVGF